MENKAAKKHKIFGRPPIAEEEKRAVKVAVFLSRAEAAQLLEKSRSADIGLPELLRRSGLSRKIEMPRPVFDAEAVIELRAIGQNINRLTRDVARARKQIREIDYHQLEIILQRELDALNKIKNEIIKNK
jgi:hypothetical protein